MIGHRDRQEVIMTIFLAGPSYTRGTATGQAGKEALTKSAASLPRQFLQRTGGHVQNYERPSASNIYIYSIYIQCIALIHI